MFFLWIFSSFAVGLHRVTCVTRVIAPFSSSLQCLTVLPWRPWNYSNLPTTASWVLGFETCVIATSPNSHFLNAPHLLSEYVHWGLESSVGRVRLWGLESDPQGSHGRKRTSSCKLSSELHMHAVACTHSYHTYIHTEALPAVVMLCSLVNLSNSAVCCVLELSVLAFLLVGLVG